MQPTSMGPTPPNPSVMPWFLFTKSLKQNAATTQDADKQKNDLNSKKAIELYSQLSGVNNAITRLKTVLTETRRMVPNPVFLLFSQKGKGIDDYCPISTSGE